MYPVEIFWVDNFNTDVSAYKVSNILDIKQRQNRI